MKIGWALDMIGWACAQPFPTLIGYATVCRIFHILSRQDIIICMHHIKTGLGHINTGLTGFHIYSDRPVTYQYRLDRISHLFRQACDISIQA